MKFSAYEFAKITEDRIKALSMKEYHERPRVPKRLIEEIYPLSRFALALTQPGLDVEVEAPENENSETLDGHIWTSGFRDQSFDVEVTFAGYERLEKLRSRLMLRQGFTPGAGPIEQDKKTGEIIATMEAEDRNAQITRLAESISDVTQRIQKSRLPLVV